MLRERDGEVDMGERSKWGDPLERPASTKGGQADNIRFDGTGHKSNGLGKDLNGTGDAVDGSDRKSHGIAGGIDGAGPSVDRIPAERVQDDRDWCEAFAGAVEAEIVPRLLALSGDKSSRRIPVPSDLVSAVADAAADAEAGVVESHILSHMVNGASLADALLDIVGPAARLLGTDWEADRRDFMEVTIGLGTLQQVLSSLSDERMDSAMPNRRILLGPTPGEDHTLGLAIIDHLFRGARWDVVFDPYAGRRELIDSVHAEWFAVAGLTLASDLLLDEAKETIAALKEASMNPRLRILMGGPAFEGRADLGRALGADAVATDGRNAVEIANQWVADPAEESLR